MKNKMPKIMNHFQNVDPILYSVANRIDEIEILKPRKSNEYFSALCREIIGQQLNGKVARIIFNRFKELFPNKKITPKYILQLPDQKIRDVGMAWSKVSFIKDLAKKTLDNSLNLKNLSDLDNQQVIEELTKVKGIGPWTAEMFLMFTLGREDIFSNKDLGIKKAIISLYGKKKEITQEKIDAISEKWSPYKTYACLILWKSLEI